jgi:AraC-like DNA-binding protein
MRLLLTFILLSMSFTISCSDSGEKDEIADLKGEWLLTRNSFVKADSNNNRLITEKKIKLPGSWSDVNKTNKNLVSLITLTKKIVINSKDKGKFLTLSLGNIAIADETYFNNIKIGSTGKIPHITTPLNYDFTWLYKRIYPIPENLIKYDEENTIRIKVFSHIISGINGNLSIQDNSKINKLDILNTNFFNLNIKSIIFTVILGFFFIVVLEAYKKRLMIFYSIILLFIVTTVYIHLIGFNYENGLIRFKIILSLFSFGYFFFTLCVEQFFEKSIKYAHPIFIFLIFITQILIIISPNSKSLIYTAGSVSLIVNSLLIIYYIFITLSALIHNFKRYWILLIATIPIIISIVQTFIDFYLMEFNTIPSTFLFHLPIVLLALLLTTLFNFINFHTESDSIKKSLLLKTMRIKQINKKLEKDKKPETKEIISNLIDYIDNNYVKKYNRMELAKQFELNEDYIGQIFKKKTGSTISNYINMKRINASKDLLLNSNSKIIDIAYHIGFESLVHFHREFKKNTGTTPKNYRVDNKIEN